MAQLRHSRNRFFHRNPMPRDRSFWHYLWEEQAVLDRLSADAVRLHRSWEPLRSNCPMLTSTLDDIISSVPDQWISRAKNIFVGRVLGGENNATAWSHKQAGIVEIDLQFTYAVDGYVTAFDEFVSAVHGVVNDAIREPPEQAEVSIRKLNDRFSEPWNHIGNSHRDWTNPEIVAPWNTKLLKVGAARRDQLDVAVDVCEEFVMAHELGHHLLGHTNSSLPRNLKADKLVQRALADPALLDIVRRLNPSQRSEAHADILAFLIVGRTIDRTPSFPDLYRATFGSILAFTALAHLNGTWIDPDVAATHPSFRDRFMIVRCLSTQLSSGRVRGESGDHPLDLLAQLATFTSVAFNDWLARRSPEKFSPANLLDAVDRYLDERERIPVEHSTDKRNPDDT